MPLSRAADLAQDRRHGAADRQQLQPTETGLVENGPVARENFRDLGVGSGVMALGLVHQNEIEERN